MVRGSMAHASSQTTAGDEQTPGFSEQAVCVGPEDGDPDGGLSVCEEKRKLQPSRG